MCRVLCASVGVVVAFLCVSLSLLAGFASGGWWWGLSFGWLAFCGGGLEHFYDRRCRLWASGRLCRLHEGGEGSVVEYVCDVACDECCCVVVSEDG